MDIQIQNMNPQQIELYQRIQAFSFDQPDACLSFSGRLARDNGWSLEYAQRVIEEYKKFAFLAVAAGHPVSPSDVVDRVWHLHLTYTRSYWQDFCPNVLQKPLHHEPSQGGLAERTKLESWYDQTLASYRHFFEPIPPVDIWPNSQKRLGRDLQHFMRVNTQQNWGIPKPALPPWLAAKSNHILIFFLSLSLTVLLASCEDGDDYHPLFQGFQGSDFLNFYLESSSIVISLAWFLRFLLLSPQGKPDREYFPLTLYEMAYLVGNEIHVVNTAIVKLVQENLVIVEPTTKNLTLNQPVAAFSDPVEQAVANAIKLNEHINTAQLVEAPSIREIRERLQQLNLLLPPKQSFQARIYPTLLIAAFLILGIAKFFSGIIFEKKPIIYLFLLFVLCAIVASISWIVLPPIHSTTYYGSWFLKKIYRDIRLRLSPIRIQQTNPQFLVAFIVWGVPVLPDDMLANLKEVLTPVSNGNGGGCSGNSGGDCSSCGGGGGGCSGGDCGSCGG